MTGTCAVPWQGSGGGAFHRVIYRLLHVVVDQGCDQAEGTGGIPFTLRPNAAESFDGNSLWSGTSQKIYIKTTNVVAAMVQ